MADIVVFGAGDIAKLARFYFDTDSPHRVIAFTVDAAYRNGEAFDGLPLVPFEQVDAIYPPSRCQLFVAVSYTRMNQVRAQKYGEAKTRGYTLPSYVSSRCTNLAQEPVGDNCFILEDNTVQPFVTIGNNVTLWSGNHIGHDVTIEDHCFITSHVVVSGWVRIGTRSFIGVNATLRNSITIAPETLIGAGAIIMKNTKPKQVYMPERAKLFPKASDEIDL